MKILGIETSCDETAAAVVDDNRLLSNVVSSSVNLHKIYGGVVPEIAARSHLEVIIPVIDEALKTAETTWSEIDAIAVTKGPGLSGSLLIGLITARSLAITQKKPLYGINHVEAHVYASFLTVTKLQNYHLSADVPQFPLLALIVSGGHTQLVLFKNHFDYELLGQTTDDAVGEAFDKVAKILGLPYPGGPSISEAALHGNPQKYRLPEPKTKNIYDFSYSGLKTAVLRLAQAESGHDFTFPSSALPEALSEAQKHDIAASFQRAALDLLVNKLKVAAENSKPTMIVVAGGVAANPELRRLASEAIPQPIIYPDFKLCTDNAAMVAALGYYKAYAKQTPDNPYKLVIDPVLTM